MENRFDSPAAAGLLAGVGTAGAEKNEKCHGRSIYQPARARTCQRGHVETEMTADGPAADPRCHRPPRTGSQAQAQQQRAQHVELERTSGGLDRARPVGGARLPMPPRTTSRFAS